MTKGRRKSSRRKRQSTATLRQNGLRAFNRADYTRAIEVLEQAGRQAPRTRPLRALAEAHFRRGVTRLYGKIPSPQAALEDLRQASKFDPGCPHYAYHLGLAAHRQGNLDEAVLAYGRAIEGGGEFASRVSYPLALALFQRGEDPAAHSVWSALADKERAMLSQAGAFRRRPYVVTSNAPPLWRGMAALDAGDREQALVALDRVLENWSDPAEKGMAHYYRGVLAARDQDWGEARRQWGAARLAGLATPHLVGNVGELYHRLAEERLEHEDAEGALTAAKEALRQKPDDKRLGKLLSQAHQRLADQAASAGQWEAARGHWEAANAAGSSFRLAHNLALAYERCEDFLLAGEMWREALRRRPRRADHPDAVDDEQVARLWRRSAEAYRKAGEYDEAVHVYRQAVKWNPDNLEVRLELSGALLANGQVQAAENELNRVLERDPDNVPALLGLGEVIAASGSWWPWNSPTSHWQRVLELEPDNATALQLLANFYQDKAEHSLSWGNVAGAAQMYRRALEYQPKDSQILAALGGCYLRLGDDDAARSSMEEAFVSGPANLNVYDEVIHACLDVGETDRAWAVLERAEAAVDTIPYEFYLQQASYCIRDYPSELVRPWLERAVERAPADAPVFLMIGEMAMTAGVSSTAEEYLKRAIAANQGPGQAYLILGILAIRDGDRRRAEQHWSKAERLARQNRDTELGQRVEQARFLFTGPPGLRRLLWGLGREHLDEIQLPDLLDDEYEGDDSEFYFDV